ncbi:MAG: hypothetical protein IKT82_03545 [Bacteroidaceae bacterium]|nr:hypothetical protein [Bacteroidaceae bacterium]
MKRIIEVVKLLLLWAFIPPLFFKNRRQAGWKKRWCIPLVIFSPMCMVFWVPILVILILFVAFAVSVQDREVPYENLPFKTHAEISALTEMSDLPEFTFVRSYRNNWDGITRTHFRFKDTLTLAQQEKFTAKCSERDNIFWNQVDSTRWMFKRGWNSEEGGLMKNPQGIEDSCSQVEISFYTDGFIVYNLPNGLMLNVEEFPNLKLPPYEYVNLEWRDCGPDYTNCATVKLKQKPSVSFYKGWTYDAESGTYSFVVKDEKGQWEWEATSRKGSRLVCIKYATF